MIIKSYEILSKNSDFSKYNMILLYGENFGLKKEIRELIKNSIKKNMDDLEIQTIYEDEISDNKNDLYNSIYSGSLFNNKKLITIHNGTDKIFENISDINKKHPENVFLIIFSNILEKKSKLRIFFEKNENTACIACYLDTEKDLMSIAQSTLKEKNINLSRESINLLIEKSNSDRNNLRNEIKKITAYSLNKKEIGPEEIKSLINFSGEYKSDILVNECLCGNIHQYKKIISDLYINTINQTLLLRILSNKIQRLLKIKEQTNKTYNIDTILNSFRPPIFWKEKPLVKKQLTIWKLKDLKEIVSDINNTEVLCKKNPNISNSIFFNFFLGICKKANSFF
tara:strand:- start:2091 stop:3110 length:1020 start_codon:yes stop_codon:yes gene_type:complete